MNKDEVETITNLLEKELTDRYGPLISGEDLRKVLGFSSMEAFRQAVSRKQIKLPVFTPANRRGKFALAHDVARWLATQRQAVLTELSDKPTVMGKEVNS